MEFLDFFKWAQKETRSQQVEFEKIPNNSAIEAIGKRVVLQVFIDTLILNEDFVPINVNPYTSNTV